MIDWNKALQESNVTRCIEKIDALPSVSYIGDWLMTRSKIRTSGAEGLTLSSHNITMVMTRYIYCFNC